MGHDARNAACVHDGAQRCSSPLRLDARLEEGEPVDRPFAREGDEGERRRLRAALVARATARLPKWSRCAWAGVRGQDSGFRTQDSGVLAPPLLHMQARARPGANPSSPLEPARKSG